MKVQMFKLIFYVCFVLLILHKVDCLYAGESCNDDGKPGNCTVLKDCKHLLEMIKDAGPSKPPYVYEKLQRLNCGYINKEPIVCCTYIEEPQTHFGDVLPDYNSVFYLNNKQDKYAWGVTSHGDTLEGPADKIGHGTVQTGDLPNVQDHRNLNLLSDICGNIESNRILGGSQINLFEMPWMVLLSYSSPRGTETNCGGTLISEYYVLTAAHCVAFLRPGLTLRNVILGEYDVEQDPDCMVMNGKQFCAPNAIVASIDRVIPHQEYSTETKFHDIALIRLYDPVDFTSPSTKPICLPTTPELQRESLVGVNATIAGWGITLDKVSSSVVQSVTLPVLNNSACTRAYKRALPISEKQICAGGIENVDSCTGDSGGPLMIPGLLGRTGLRFIQRGVISFGSRHCGVKNFPTVYTNIAYYVDWILDNISD